MAFETKILKAYDPIDDSENIEIAGKALREGGLVAFPTETVYGIGANALDSAAVTAIFEAKGRPQDNPLIVHLSDIAEIAPLVADLPKQAERLAEAFWPGPLTMIFPRGEAIPGIVSAGLDTVAIRIPSHPVARALIKSAGVPVAAPSANRSGSPSPTSADHCIRDLEGRVDIILDGGYCEVGVESTVLSLAGERPKVLRPGGVTIAMLEDIIGPVELDSAILNPLEEGRKPASPGMKYRHYAPKAEVILVEGDSLAFALFCREHAGPGIFALCFDEDIVGTGIPAVSYGSVDDPEEQARRLFASLRELDDMGAKIVYARPPHQRGIGFAVYNRMLRAASFRKIPACG